MVLQGFVDDSGSGEGKFRGDVFTLSGFLATAERWERFSDEWHRICDQEPKTPNFKMRKANRLKEYRWDEDQRHARITDLVKLINESAQYRINSTVSWSDYDLFVKGKVPSQIDSPYFLLYYNVIFAFSEFMEKAGLEGTVDWVFDEQGSIGLEALRWYEFIKLSAPNVITKRLGGTPIFKNDDEFLPLKSADMLAWQMRRHMDVEQRLNQPVNPYLNDLLNVHGTHSIITGNDLAEFVANLGHGLLLKSRMRHFLPPVRSG